ncbi:MAG: HAD family hydrolase [Solirubrobacteraceae bacterium]
MAATANPLARVPLRAPTKTTLQSAGLLTPTGGIRAIISDFGGVLTSPLVDAFRAFQDASGIPLPALGMALGALQARDGVHPLFELETGRMTEARFVSEVGEQLTLQLGREISMAGFGAAYFGHLQPNERVIEHMRALRARGYRMAICTNNVREWECRWRSMLPIDEIFHIVVDSAFVASRKPEAAIYKLTLERLGVAPQAALFIDDTEINCAAARQLGIAVVHFRSTDQAIADVEAALAG